MANIHEMFLESYLKIEEENILKSLEVSARDKCHCLVRRLRKQKPVRHWRRGPAYKN